MMLGNLLNPKTFLFKLSLHVGVVTICSMGMMLHTISLFINLTSPDAEPDDRFLVIHIFIVLTFITSGFTVYIVGMTAAYRESPYIARMTLIFLLAHGVLWFFLTALSFLNNYTINSLVCVDNRCADRLYIKNSNWRRNDEAICNNPSFRLKQAQLADMPLNPEESESGSGEDEDVDLEDEQERFESSPWDPNQKPETGDRAPVVHDEYDSPSDLENEVLEEQDIGRRTLQKTMFKNENGQNGSRLKRNVRLLYNSSARKIHSRLKLRRLAKNMELRFHIQSFNKSTKDGSDRDAPAVPYMRTPIGYIGCNAPAQIAFSVVCALTILCFWYVYPIIIFHSYERRLRVISQRMSVFLK